MLSLILGWITGLAGPISSIISKISDLQIAKVQASTDQQKAKIDQQIEEAHDRKAVLVAEAGSRVASAINTSFRALLTIGPALYIIKITAWDKVVGSFMGCSGGANRVDCQIFNTDALKEPHMWAIIGGIIAFYFMYDIYAKSRS